MKLFTQERIDYNFAKKSPKNRAIAIASYKRKIAIAKSQKQPFDRIQIMLSIFSKITFNPQ